MFDKLFDAFELSGKQLFYVGGCCRDKVLNIECNDYDMATSALPDETIEILKSVNLPTFEIGKEFGTILTFVDGQKIEITTFRSKESYKKGSRKPSVEFGKSIEEDLARRDLTINSFAMTRDFKVIDPFKGVEHLKNKLIVTPLDPKISFGDDPLRMLRVCRFATRGFGEVSNETINGMKVMCSSIHNISCERIFEEMSKLLMLKDPTEGIKLMEKTGLLKEVFPELTNVIDFTHSKESWLIKNVWEHTLEVVRRSPQRIEVRFAALFHDIGKPETFTEKNGIVHFYNHEYVGAELWRNIANRLKVSTEFKQHVYFLIDEHMTPGLLDINSKVGIRRLIRRAENKLDDLFDLSLCDITSTREEKVLEKTQKCNALRNKIKRIEEESKITKLKLPKGLGLIISKELNIIPGPKLGAIMKKLEQMLIDGDIDISSDFVIMAKKVMDKQNEQK